MAEKVFVTHNNPENKYEGLITYGNRDFSLPEDAIISITLGENFPIWKTIVNACVSHLVMRQLKKSPKLLYAEMKGDIKAGYGLTLSVWETNSMKNFRDSGSHKFAMRFFSWIFYSGKAHAYFLTYKNTGTIPSTSEAFDLVKKYGKFYESGKLIRKAKVPVLKEEMISVKQEEPT